MMITLICL